MSLMLAGALGTYAEPSVEAFVCRCWAIDGPARRFKGGESFAVCALEESQATVN
jgi:hypothetical protein